MIRSTERSSAVTSEPLWAFGHSMGGATLALLEDRRPGTLRAAYLFEPVVMPGTLRHSWTARQGQAGRER